MVGVTKIMVGVPTNHTTLFTPPSQPIAVFPSELLSGLYLFILN
jgi:hypothetical protein